MNTIFMNSETSKTSNLTDHYSRLQKKINLKRSYRYVALWNFSTYYTWKNIKKSYKNKRFDIST